MGEGKVFVMMMFLFAISVSVGASDRKLKWWPMNPEDNTRSCSSGLNRASSSVVFKLYGNVYPDGYYFVQVNLGNPPKPYFLDPDTGSDLTWVQCDAPCVRCTQAPHPPYRPTNDLVVCKDPLCASLHSGDYKCDRPEQCDYEVEYADGGSSLGVLVNDVFSLNLTNGIRIRPRLAFGVTKETLEIFWKPPSGVWCGYDQSRGSASHMLDGILGLGNGKSSIVSQLHHQGVIRNVLGHCLSGGKGIGYLFFGDSLYDSSQVVWTPMSRHSRHYSADSGELILGGKSSGNKNLAVVFDTGSSYTYLGSQPYLSLVSWLMKELKGKPLREAKEDNTLPHCWKGKKPFRSISEVRKYFEPLALKFNNGWRSKPQLEIPPEGYLIISSRGSACLGILNGTEVGLQNFNILGDISMQDKMVVYDNEKKAIGWTAANCDRLPISNAVCVM